MLCLWSLDDELEQIYSDPVAIWKRWADDAQGYGIKSGHHVAEENPAALAAALKTFLGNVGSRVTVPSSTEVRA